MHPYLYRLKQRLDAINRLRVDRALSSMGPSFKYVYTLLPILLHFHHPALPGYLDGNVPHGICYYAPNKFQFVLLNYIGDHIDEFFIKFTHSEQPITGIYSMGSTSSIGQNNNSDLDIWVCHQSWLNQEERILLQKKCDLIEQWATRYGVDVNFFLIDSNRFKYNEYNILNNEHWNYTQRILLLDEFYRTAVRMGGKRILWNMVPEEKEIHYDDYVLSLYDHGALIPNEWIDLGGLNIVSIEECFDYSLLKLCSNINVSYKSVLKMLLLESYFWEYPRTQLLAMYIKQCLHNGLIISYGLDPYCMMLNKVTCYLIKINDMERLDIVRSCFYWKVCEKLSQSEINAVWRRKILIELVKMWGWDHKRLLMLDSCVNYKIDAIYCVYM